jgi:two-component system, response regulator YesN
MAYRILIIDDEPVVREGISETIEWGTHGFELVGACRDGREGLQAVEELRPDVVLTDICMPFVDGLELAATIGDQYPAIKILLLTGHDEFEYAQAAIKLKVRDFLLKPITADEIRKVLDTLRAEIDAERDHRKGLERLSEQVKASLPVYRERFLNRLVGDTVSDTERIQSFRLLDLDLPGPVFVALVVDPDPVSSPGYEEGVSDERLFGLGVHDIVRDVVSELSGAVSFSTPQEQAVVLLSVGDTDSAVPAALAVAEQISDRTVRELGKTVSIGIGEGRTEGAAVMRTFQDASAALDYRFVLGPGQIMTIQQARGGELDSDFPKGSDYRERFLQTVKTGTAEEARGALQQVIQAVRAEQDDIEGCVVFMYRLLADTLNALEDIGISCSDVRSLGTNPFDRLAQMKTLGEMERWFSLFVPEALEILDSRRLQHSQRKARAAQQFIDSNFADPDLSLQQVCSVLAVSKSYLSPIFKAGTGMTFVEYVTRCRMEEAKKLLRSESLKVYEIAERVGFRDAHYFSLTFKKQTGLTPREFQDSTVQRVQ